MPEVTMKSDLKDMAAYLLYCDIPFQIVREENYIRLLTDLKEIKFKYTGEMFEATTFNVPHTVGEYRLHS